MAMPSRRAASLVPAAALALLMTLAGCAQVPPSPPADPAGRLYARGLNEIGEFYIERVSSRKLVLGGAGQLSRLDSGLSVTETPGPANQTEIVLDYNRRQVAAYPDPPDTQPEAWGGLIGQLIADAKRVSPKLARLSDDRIDTALFDGMTAGLDRFSRYASPAAAREQRAARDGFGGIGVTLDPAATGFRIVRVAAGEPADRAGIEAGDRIVAVDEKPTAGRSKADVMRALHGPIASPVEIAVERPGRTAARRVRLRRTLIVEPTVTMTRDGDVAILRITSFNQNTTQQVVEDLRSLQRQSPPLRGIVLDLRGNPGGLLDQAVSLADVFIPNGPIVGTIGRHPAARQLFAASGDSLAPQVPIVALINGGSASAAEIVASALQDAGRAVVVGSASYGKGTVQTVLRLPNDGELILTWAELVTRSGYLLNGHGVVPTLCTSDLGNDPSAVDVALQRVDPSGPAPALFDQPRASLDEAAWTQLRHDCPERLGKHPIDLIVAERLLADPALYRQAVQRSAAAKRTAGAGQTARPAGAAALTGGRPWLSFGRGNP